MSSDAFSAPKRQRPAPGGSVGEPRRDLGAVINAALQTNEAETFLYVDSQDDRGRWLQKNWSRIFQSDKTTPKEQFPLLAEGRLKCLHVDDELMDKLVQQLWMTCQKLYERNQELEERERACQEETRQFRALQQRFMELTAGVTQYKNAVTPNIEQIATIKGFIDLFYASHMQSFSKLEEIMDWHGLIAELNVGEDYDDGTLPLHTPSGASAHVRRASYSPPTISVVPRATIVFDVQRIPISHGAHVHAIGVEPMQEGAVDKDNVCIEKGKYFMQKDMVHALNTILPKTMKKSDLSDVIKRDGMKFNLPNLEEVHCFCNDAADEGWLQDFENFATSKNPRGIRFIHFSHLEEMCARIRAQVQAKRSLSEQTKGEVITAVDDLYDTCKRSIEE